MPYTVLTKEARHPLEIYTLTGAGLFGGVGITFGVWPKTIELTLGDPSHWLQDAWGGMLFLGAVIALWGISLPKRSNGTGALLEQVGLIAVAAAMLTYGGALIAYASNTGAGLAVLVICIAVGCIHRYWLIEKVIRRTILEHKAAKMARLTAEIEQDLR